MLIIDTVSTCFGHLYAYLQEKDTCYCMWSVFSGSAGCGGLRYCGAMFEGVITVKVAVRTATFTVITPST